VEDRYLYIIPSEQQPYPSETTEVDICIVYAQTYGLGVFVFKVTV
jgi:hypothetical protein